MSSLTQNFDSTNQVTMSSIEIVDFINAFRKADSEHCYATTTLWQKYQKYWVKITLLNF